MKKFFKNESEITSRSMPSPRRKSPGTGGRAVPGFNVWSAALALLLAATMAGCIGPSRFMKYKRFVEQDDAQTQDTLAWCHDNGKGVDQDFAKAVK